MSIWVYVVIANAYLVAWVYLKDKSEKRMKAVIKTMNEVGMEAGFLGLRLETSAPLGIVTQVRAYADGKPWMSYRTGLLQRGPCKLQYMTEEEA